MDKHILFSKIKRTYTIKTDIKHYVGNNSLNAAVRMLTLAVKNSSPMRRFMPVFVLSIPDGQGTKTAARLLSKQISKLRYNDPHPIMKHYTLTPEDASLNQAGTIGEIRKSLEDETGFQFCVVDLDIYVGMRIYDPLILKLMDLISLTKIDRVYILRIRPMDRETVTPMLDYLSNYICVKLIEFSVLTAKLALEHTKARMQDDYQLELCSDAESSFVSYFNKQIAHGKYLGFKTLDRMRLEMYFNYLTSGSETGFIEPSHITRNADRIHSETTSTNALDELDKMIGLDEIKNQVKEIVKTTSYKKSAGLNDQRTLHLMFTGPPGTGKTAVAKLIGRILKECGVLPNGRLIEVSRKDLIGEYLGQTALKTIDVCKMAMGSVLFIDEAYSLAKMDNDRYGFEQECLTTLLAEMENNRDKFVVIMAGYKEEMEQLCRTNAGLRDRFAFKIDFPSYTKDQLSEIFDYQLKSRNYRISDEANEAAKKYIQTIPTSVMQDKNFSNARFIRNFTERIISKLALRVINGKLTCDDDLIIQNDIAQTLEDADIKNMNNGKEKKVIGF